MGNRAGSNPVIPTILCVLTPKTWTKITINLEKIVNERVFLIYGIIHAEKLKMMLKHLKEAISLFT
jgi:hypothetical protein